MSTQTQSTGQIQDILAIVKRRAWQLTIPCAFGVAVGTFFAAIIPRKYDVETRLEVHEMTAPIGGRGFEATAIAREIPNASSMIRDAAERLRAVIEKQEWEDYAGLNPEEKGKYLQRVRDNIGVKPTVTKTQQGSQYVLITYSDSDPQRAARFCNELRDAYRSEIVNRGRKKALEDRDKLQEFRKIKEDIYRDNERKLAELKKQNHLSLTQPAPGGGKTRDEDPLYVAFDKSAQSLRDANVELAKEKANHDGLQAKFEREPETKPDSKTVGGVNVDTQITAIQQQITQINDSIVGLKPAHSKYQEGQSKITALEKLRDQLRASAQSGAEEIHYVPNETRAALQVALDASDQKLIGLEAQVKALEETNKALGLKFAEQSDVYRQLTGLENEVTSSLNAFNDADLAYQHQKDFCEYISGPGGDPFEVIARAEPPKDPSSPIVPLIIAAGAVVGLALGLASSVVAEFGRNAFRSVGDVARNMSVPVLGAVTPIVTRAETRNRTVRRAALALASVVLIGTVLYVTWAWTNRPSQLGAPLRDAINDLREKMR